MFLNGESYSGTLAFTDCCSCLVSLLSPTGVSDVLYYVFCYHRVKSSLDISLQKQGPHQGTASSVRLLICFIMCEGWSNHSTTVMKLWWKRLLVTYQFFKWSSPTWTQWHEQVQEHKWINVSCKMTEAGLIYIFISLLLAWRHLYQQSASYYDIQLPLPQQVAHCTWPSLIYLPQTDFPGCVVGGLLRLDLPYGLVTGASRTCTPIFGTPCRVWRAPSQLDSSLPAVPRGTGTPAPPMSPRRCHWWDYTPVEQTEAGTPWAWDVAVQFQTSNRVLQSKQALLALWFQNSVCNRLCTGE